MDKNTIKVLSEFDGNLPALCKEFTEMREFIKEQGRALKKLEDKCFKNKLENL